MIRTKVRPDLQQLRTELAAASLATADLGTSPTDDGELEVFTYSEGGEIVPLPPEAAAIVAAHVPPPGPTKPDYGDDAPGDYPSRAADAVTSLRAYLGASSPTVAQTVAALKAVIRLVLYLARRSR